MSHISSHKDLQVSQKAMNLVDCVYEVARRLPPEERFGLSSQMTRSAISVPSNIAEGYRRNNKKEYVHFCAIALGSASELETQLLIVKRNFDIASVDTVIDLQEEVSKMLYSLIQKLKASP